MATNAADPQSIVTRIRQLSRSALYQSSRPGADRAVVAALMDAAGSLIKVADNLQAGVEGKTVTPEHAVFEVPAGRSRP